MYVYLFRLFFFQIVYLYIHINLERCFKISVRNYNIFMSQRADIFTPILTNMFIGKEFNYTKIDFS